MARWTYFAYHYHHFLKSDLFSAPGVGVWRIAGSSEADLSHALTVKQPLLHAASERCAMSDLHPQGHVTCVSMSIHMDQTHRSMSEMNQMNQHHWIIFCLPFLQRKMLNIVFCPTFLPRPGESGTKLCDLPL